MADYARTLLRRTRRHLRRRGHYLAPAAYREVRGAVTELEAALSGGGEAAVEAAVARVQSADATYFAFLRTSKLREWIESGVVAFLALLVIRGGVVDYVKVGSGGMAPTLETGDHVVVLRPAFGIVPPFAEGPRVQYAHPRPGEMVMFRDPMEARGTMTLKRVAAVAGETVEIREGRLWIDGAPVADAASEAACADSAGPAATPPATTAAPPEPCVRWTETLGGHRYTVAYRGRGADFGPVTVPPGRFFVLGDNRNHTDDSRVWGPLPETLLRGKVLASF